MHGLRKTFADRTLCSENRDVQIAARIDLRAWRTRFVTASQPVVSPFPSLRT
jgi:hypothetical protein